jgi:hypothetical protein
MNEGCDHFTLLKHFCAMGNCSHNCHSFRPMYNFPYTFACASVQIYDLPRCCVGGNDNTGDEDAKGHSKSKAKNKRRRPGYAINLSWQLHAVFLNLF